jgi:phosphonopyruvate decarboxylase
VPAPKFDVFRNLPDETVENLISTLPSNIYGEGDVVLRENEAHDSTGGQATLSRGTAFGAVAQACGYTHVVGTDAVVRLTEELAAHTPQRGPTLVHFRARTGTLAKLGRPTISPAEVKLRLMRQLGSA